LQSKAKEKGLPWAIAKGFNGSAPISEWLDKNQFENLQKLNFSLKVNGQIKQEGNSALMLFSIDYIVSYLSQFFTLKTGDIIFTGTPKGVGPVSIGDKLEGYIENQKLLNFDIK
jgi:2-keto-4-pentenoate hydratase/2-oxohepta-3-ene-1,7-dioic acid hydratase in catechol pathway